MAYNPIKTGSSTQSGTGVLTAFNVAHGLGITPSYFNISPSNAVTAALFYLSADATNITVTFLVAPSLGTNNISFRWMAIP